LLIVQMFGWFSAMRRPSFASAFANETVKQSSCPSLLHGEKLFRQGSCLEFGLDQYSASEGES